MVGTGSSVVIGLKSRQRGALICFAFAVSVAFAVGLVVVAPQAVAQTGGQAEWQRVVEAARKEGKLVAGIPTSPELRKGLEKVFEEKFAGIRLELIAGPAQAIANRIVSEYKAGVRNFGVFVGGAFSNLSIVAEGVAEPFEPYMILPEVKDPKNWFGGHIWVDNKATKRFIYSFQAYVTEPGWYNADLLKPEEIRSYDDFLSPKWKGRIGFHEPRKAGAGGAMWNYLWIVKGQPYLEKLAEQELLVSSDQRQLADFLAKGRVAVVLGPGYRVLSPFVQAGLPLRPLPIPKEGVHATFGVGGTTIMKNPPHPNAAKVFVNFLLSKEGQELFGKAVGQATRRLDVDTKWLVEIGIQAAKDTLTVEEYLKREGFFEDKIPLVAPAEELAKRLLK